jgi:hypothetical protein
MQTYITWIRATGISEFVRTQPWAWPTLETLHFVGMSLLIGVIALLDVRLLGFLKGIEIRSLRRLMPWGIAGFALNLVSGVLFCLAAPDQYVRNPAFYAKILFLVVAGLNALYFETHSGHRVLETGHFETTPTSFKVAGAISLFSWFMVLYWGRMLPFIGNAF